MSFEVLLYYAMVGVYYALLAYFYVLIASILLSWLPELRRNKIGQFIDRLANPYMRIFRGLIVIGMFDFTPIIGFIIYRFGLNQVYLMIDLMYNNIISG